MSEKMTKEEFQQFIAGRIKSLRILRGWSQVELSKRSDVKRSCIAMIENGYSMPELYTAWKLAKGFRIKLDKLVKEEVTKCS
jgi:DNA-binding XRE family transcriptional regulator